METKEWREKMERDYNYLVKRKINAKRQFRRKIIITMAFSGILLLLVCIGLIRAIFGSEKEENQNDNDKQTVAELTPGAEDNQEEANPTSTPTPTTTPTPLPGSGKKIIVDPGHGGEDLGSVRDGLYEKNANLAIALYLRDILEEAGYEVYMIREEDVTVENESRPKTAIEEEGDLYVSIHLNSLEEDSDATQGAEAWYADLRNDDSDVLAQMVVDELSKEVGMKNRGIKLSNKLIVLKYNGIPACLVECGFISSATEREKLFSADYQKQVAQGIANGIIKFLENESD